MSSQDFSGASDENGVTDYRTLIVKKISPWVAPLLAPLLAVWTGVVHHTQQKIDHYRDLDEKYAQLSVDYGSLKEQYEALKFAKETKSAAHETKVFSKRLSQETGLQTGRTIASFNYKVPTDLNPSQLYTLSLSFLLGHEEEKAAVILESLMSLDPKYRNSKNFMMLGVIWYRLDNLVQANESFDSAFKLAKGPDGESLQASLRLWKAVISKRMKKEKDANFWLDQLIDHHPESPETSWVNPTGGES